MLAETLCLRVRVASDSQRRALGVGRDALRREVSRGLVKPIRCLAIPSPDMKRPLAVWQPGDEPIDCGHVSYLNDRRWTEAPRRLTCFVATPKAARLYGVSRVGLKSPLQATHDLAVTQCYLAQPSDVQAAWLCEDMVKVPRGEKTPDAFIFQGGRIAKVIEVAGLGYGKERIERLHRFLVEKELPHEIW